jgi:transaldolase
LETFSLKAEGMIEEAQNLAETGDNVVVKLIFDSLKK